MTKILDPIKGSPTVYIYHCCKGWVIRRDAKPFWGYASKCPKCGEKCRPIASWRVHPDEHVPKSGAS